MFLPEPYAIYALHNMRTNQTTKAMLLNEREDFLVFLTLKDGIVTTYTDGTAVEEWELADEVPYAPQAYREMPYNEVTLSALEPESFTFCKLRNGDVCVLFEVDDYEPMPVKTYSIIFDGIYRYYKSGAIFPIPSQYDIETIYLNIDKLN